MTDDLPPRPRPSFADALFAAGGIALGGFFVWQTLSLEVAPSYAKVSPQLFGLIVGIGLCVCSGLLLNHALRGERAEPAAEEDSDPNAPTDWRAMGLIAVGIIAQIVLIQWLGFIVASSLLFTLTARGFRLKQRFTWASVALDSGIAIALSSVAFYGFTAGLGIELPFGKLWGRG